MFGGEVDLDTQNAKVLSMRRRSDERLAQLMDAKRRVLGVDTRELDAQCEEKRQARETCEMEDAAYVEYESAMRDVVFARECAEREEIARAHADHKWDWDESKARRDANDAAAKIRVAIDPERTGAAAAQKFEGEDAVLEQRESAQGRQMQSWHVAQIEEKDLRKAEDLDEVDRYAAYEDFVVEQRRQLEDEEQRTRRARHEDLARRNANDAIEVKARNAVSRTRTQNVERAEIMARMRDRDLCEDTATAHSMLGSHRYRPDHFKGFAREQVSKILASNDGLIDDKRRTKRDMRETLADYDDSQAALLKLAFDEEETYQYEVKLAADALQTELLAQRDVERERLRKMKEDRFGHIGPGYMDGFGTSSR